MIQDTPNPRLITVLHPHSEANGGAIEYLLTTHGFVGTVEDASELRGFSNSVDNNELQSAEAVSCLGVGLYQQ